MRNMVIIIIALLLPVSSAAQTFNLLRSIYTFPSGEVIDTAEDGFTQRGTMEIVGDSVSRTIYFASSILLFVRSLQPRWAL